MERVMSANFEFLNARPQTREFGAGLPTPPKRTTEGLLFIFVPTRPQILRVPHEKAKPPHDCVRWLLFASETIWRARA